ncbi:MAG: ferredoxin [Candidatus Moranbacteria bacterium]|nr:ferredoxin [Candidatus Moranbacteria bacterium]PIP25507.1 MAG: ferredoxin [Candidatus Moranbacteria bacterium CG23_combo_of_CG06-09_8_20_14_all_41_28]PIV86094.1 MAG: ferredoxin [Candidatus Moranbacteria bacterium CG17_big_fil_post_rev_8_21_14_2_50_41_107]PIW94049.1 MAG: ferredoxin [Candidatus Moranbacteria bacterium CG_4_8_14_3_um_filter_41_13]PIX91572.1 MAG: ferredoxin [Candidatus Moranbacteria bacterium CG_4_10_14_3_um_filter_41_65]PJC00518.1 MAG: ferredoxin [Candidatus Moranbacteria bact
MGTKKITICHKRNDCIGCGSCALVAPERWQMNDEDGKADLKDGEWKGDEFVVAKVNEEEYKKNKEASDACPVGIIRVD